MENTFTFWETLMIAVIPAIVSGIVAIVFGHYQLRKKNEELKTQHRVSADLQKRQKELNLELEAYKTRFQKAIDDHKSSLEKELEKHRSSWTLFVNNNSHLYTKRVEKFEQLFSLLFSLDNQTRLALIPLRRYNTLDKEEQRIIDMDKLDKAGAEYNKLTRFLGTNRFYFPKPLLKSLDEMTKVYFDSLSDKKYTLEAPSNRAGWEAAREAWEKITKQLPSIKETVEDELREMIDSSLKATDEKS